VSIALALSHSLCFSCLVFVSLPLHDVLLVLLEVVQRAPLLFNPKGMRPRWSEYQPRLVGQSATHDSFLALVKKVFSVDRTRVIALAVFSLSSFLSLFMTYFLYFLRLCNGHTLFLIYKLYFRCPRGENQVTAVNKAHRHGKKPSF
jgi:hypothetical protein